MNYQAELKFLQACLAKCRVQFEITAPHSLLTSAPDLGLRRLLGVDEGLCCGCADVINNLKSHTVYMLTDPFSCHYVFIQLPENDSVFLFGPYVTEEHTSELIIKMSEEKKLPVSIVPELENYFSSIPHLDKNSQLFVVFEVFCDMLWGNEPLEIVRINVPDIAFSFSSLEEEVLGNSLWKMDMVKKRYEYENEMMDAVSKGHIHKAPMLLPAFTSLHFEKRLSDPLRDIKNYGIIMNTLLRKAAENGGVHPVFLDKLSSEYARKIESLTAVDEAQRTMLEMFDKYCRLVRKHSLKHYSPPVRKTIIAIESNLSMNLTLPMLADLQDLSASYLSRLFKKETEMNVTEYITQRRIEHAENLLRSTKLQIQTIAQHCGIMDVQYFSRLFKKINGLSPLEFRKNNQEKS